MSRSKNDNSDAVKFAQQVRDFINHEMATVFKSFEGLFDDLVPRDDVATKKEERDNPSINKNKNESKTTDYARVNPTPAYSVTYRVDPAAQPSPEYTDPGARALMALLPHPSTSAGQMLSPFWRDAFYTELKRALDAERNFAVMMQQKVIAQLNEALLKIPSWKLLDDQTVLTEETRFLVYHPKYGVNRGYLVSGKIRGAWQFGLGEHIHPTHWMEMPAGPIEHK